MLPGQAPRPTPVRLMSYQSSVSPTTPRSPYSPSDTFRVNDDFLVFELGTRYMRAGLGGENQPRCKLDFGIGQQKRVGDYTDWSAPDARVRRDETQNEETWGRREELWSVNLRNWDLGLIMDKLERALRTAVIEHVLILDEAKRRPYLIVLPTELPHALLSVVLTTVFSFVPSPPSVTLLSVPLCCTIAAGLRSALVVDIGWAETVVTGVYEYRETIHRRSSRGMKKLSWEVRRMLTTALDEETGAKNLPRSSLSFDKVEEVLIKMIWARKRNSGTPIVDAPGDTNISIPLISTPATSLQIPFHNFSEPVETAFFSKSPHSSHHDDNELPLPTLIYKTLLALPIDVRHACLQRIIFTGGGAQVPGLKPRLLAEVTHLIESRGWDPVDNYGSATRVQRKHQVNPGQDLAANNDDVCTNKDIDLQSTTPAYLQPPLPDPILAAIQRRNTQAPHPAPASEPAQADTARPRLRSVVTQGAWAGASLIAGLHVKGLVEVERERFLQYGMRALEMGHEVRGQRAAVAPAPAQTRQVSYASVTTPGVGLGVWT